MSGTKIVKKKQSKKSICSYHSSTQPNKPNKQIRNNLFDNLTEIKKDDQDIK